MQENEEENLNIGILYKYKSDDDKVLLLSIHCKINSKIDLRCKDHKCHGTASLDENEIITIKTQCYLPYENHMFCKGIIAYNKIKDNIAALDNMKEEIYLNILFKFFRKISIY